MEHKAHAEHEREANGGELPEVPAYEHLNRRVKPFPWGMNSLFFNPEVRLPETRVACPSDATARAGEQEHERRVELCSGHVLTPINVLSQLRASA
jgi:hypothetical protein